MLGSSRGWRPARCEEPPSSKQSFSANDEKEKVNQKSDAKPQVLTEHEMNVWDKRRKRWDRLRAFVNDRASLYLDLPTPMLYRAEKRDREGGDLEKVRKRAVEHAFSKKRFPNLSEDELEQRREKWAELLRGFAKHGKCSGGNKMTVLETGNVAFVEMLSHIECASERVWLESYIWDDTHLAELFVEAVVAARKRGCDVLVLVDAIGGSDMPEKHKSAMRDAGIDLGIFNPILFGAIGPPVFRDHRKILLCDDTVFVGGMNVTADEADPPVGNGRFYDIHAKVRGPVVADIVDVMRDSLEESGLGHMPREPIKPPEPISGGVYMQVLESNIRKNKCSLQSVLRRVLGSADDMICLTSAYFIPPGFLQRALFDSAKNGAQVRMLLSGESDFWPFPGDLASQTWLLQRFINRDNFEVFLHTKQHMHAKTLAVDGVFSNVGSFNFDRYSARRNLEISVSVFDPETASTLEQIQVAKTEDSHKAC